MLGYIQDRFCFFVIVCVCCLSPVQSLLLPPIVKQVDAAMDWG